MITFLPKYFSSKAINVYLIALLAVNLVFFSRSISATWFLLGCIEVICFFYFSNQLTRKWSNLSTKKFVVKLFQYSLLIRLLWVVVSYQLYLYFTGSPFEFHAADTLFYHGQAIEIAKYGVASITQMLTVSELADIGYPSYLGTLYTAFGDAILLVRIIKALIGAITVVLIFRLASRNFGEEVGKMAGIFAMLMPNLIYYCGLHLKEVEMVFLIVAFIERVDYIFRVGKISFINILVVTLLVISLFLFRTVLGACALFSIFTALIFSEKKVITRGQKTLMIFWVIVTVFFLAGGKIESEVKSIWDAKEDNQKTSLQWRAEREGGNKFATLASKSIFAPLIFVIPFPTMVDVPNQENQQLINGGNYVKNILAVFVLLGLWMLYKNKAWRQHILILAFVLSYLIVLAVSSFAQSERFHQPALPFLLIISSYGISQATNKTKNLYLVWLGVIFIAIFFWSWFKLAGRDLI